MACSKTKAQNCLGGSRDKIKTAKSRAPVIRHLCAAFIFQQTQHKESQKKKGTCERTNKNKFFNKNSQVSKNALLASFA